MHANMERNKTSNQMNQLLEYKGVLFDEWTIDAETGGIWGEMCQYCAEKYGERFENELSLGGIGACSVEGCHEAGYDNDAPGHYYVDFNPALVHFVEKKQEQIYDVDVQIHNASQKTSAFRKAGKSLKDNILER